ncbi:patatin-like phospholipase family protein [Mesorhizobium sp. CAU 1741]|uniref:patatin-like phospholipase family protein n=1 Tax=Mesorhizobium sp. CAU 1741 TaxID=3140366 RepID=UPI00325AFDF2
MAADDTTLNEETDEALIPERATKVGAESEGSGGDPSFAVAFGGGGARGLTHLHVIETLDELGIRPVAIAGSSIGAIMGAGMAAGMRGTEIGDYARATLGRSGEVASRMWRARPASMAEMFEGGVRLGQFNAERVLRAFLPETIPHRFEDLQVPLQVTATDYFGNCERVFNEGDLYLALAASAAIPAVFRPIRHEGRLLIDGGIVNPVPFDLLEGKADIIIAIDVVGTPIENGSGRPTSIDLLFGATQIMMESIVALKLKRIQPDILLRPPVSQFRVLDFLKIGQVLADTESIKDELKQAIDAAVERFRRHDG